MSNTYPKKVVYKKPVYTPSIHAKAVTYTPPVYPKVITHTPLTLEQQNYIRDYKRKLESQQNEEWAKLERRAKLLKNTKDPRQLNSLADVAGTMLMGARYDNENAFTKWIYDSIGANPITNVVAGVSNTLSHVKQTYYDPISKGEFGLAGLNALQAVGETLDILANPVKGLLMEGPKGAIKAIGTAEGRQTYTWETGNGAVDFFLELVTDPGVWGSLGTLGLVKLGGKGLKAGMAATVKQLGSEAVGKITKEIGEEATEKWVTKATYKLYKLAVSGTEITADDASKLLVKSAEGLGSNVIQHVTKDSVAELAELIAQQSATAGKQMAEKMSYRVLSTIDSVDNTIAKYTVFAPAWMPFKAAGIVKDVAQSRMYKALEPYKIAPKDTASILSYDTVIAKAGEVTESLVKEAEDNGLKSFSNSFIQKQFLRSGKKDVNTIKRFVTNINKKGFSFENYKTAIKDYLIETHGFDEAVSIEEMLDTLASAYGKAADTSPLFKPLNEGVQEAIKTFKKVQEFQLYLDKFDNLISDATKLAGLNTATKISIDDITSITDLAMRELEAAGYAVDSVSEATFQKKLVEVVEGVLLKPISDAFDFKHRADFDTFINEYVSAEIIAKIKETVPYIYELADDNSYAALIKKINDIVNEFVATGKLNAYKKRYLSYFLPEDFKLSGKLATDLNLFKMSEDFLDESTEAFIIYLKKELAQNLIQARSFLQDYSAAFVKELFADGSFKTVYETISDVDLAKTIYQKLVAHSESILKNQDISLAFSKQYGTEIAEAYPHYLKRYFLEYLKDPNSETVKKLYDNWFKYYDSTINKTIDSLIQTTAQVHVAETVGEQLLKNYAKSSLKLEQVLAHTRIIYQRLTKTALNIGKTAEEYYKHIGLAHPAFESNLKNLKAVGASAVTEHGGFLQQEAAALLKTLDTRFEATLEPAKFVIEVQKLKTQLETILDSFDNAEFDIILSYTEDIELPLRATLQDATVRLAKLLEGDAIAFNEFEDILNSLDGSLNMAKNNYFKLQEQGLSAKAFKHLTTFGMGNAFRINKTASKELKELVEQLFEQGRKYAIQLSVLEKQRDELQKTLGLYRWPADYNLTFESIPVQISKYQQQLRVNAEAVRKLMLELELLENPTIRSRNDLYNITKAERNKKIKTIKDYIVRYNEATDKLNKRIAALEAEQAEGLVKLQDVESNIKSVTERISKNNAQYDYLVKTNKTAFTAETVSTEPTKLTPEVALNEVYNNLEAAINMARDLVVLKPREFDILGTAISYFLKQEQTLNALAYIDTEPIMEFVDAILTGRNLPDTINDFCDTAYVETLLSKATTKEEIEYIEQMAKGCKALQKGVASIQEWADLRNAIEACSDLSMREKQALMTTLNAREIADMRVETIGRASSYLFDEIFKRMQNFLDVHAKKDIYTLDHHREVKLNKDKVFLKEHKLTEDTWAEMAHRSDADIFTNIDFIKHHFTEPEQMLKKTDIGIDMETTGTIAEGGEVLEVSLYKDGKLCVFKRHLAPDSITEPTQNLLNLYRKPNQTLTEARTEFFKYYNKDYTGPQFAKATGGEVFYFETEADLINAVKNTLYDNNNFIRTADGIVDTTAQGAPRLVGHNIQDFDIEFLRTRARHVLNDTEYQIFDRSVGSYSVYDTYKAIQKKDGFVALSDKSKDTIKNLMNNFITARTITEAEDLYFHADEGFLNAIPSDIFKGFRILKDTLSEKADVIFKNTHQSKNVSPGANGPAEFRAHTIDVPAETQIVRNWLNTQEALFKDALRTKIKLPNQELRKFVFTADQLSSPAFKEAFAKLLAKSPAFKTLSKAQIDNYVSYINASKMLYAEPTIINTIGYAKMFDPAVVRNWVRYTDPELPTTVGQQLGHNLFRMARTLTTRLKQIVNPKAVLVHEKDIDAFLNWIRESDIMRFDVKLGEYDGLNRRVLQYLSLDAKNISEKYVIAEYLYHKLAATKKATGVLHIDTVPKNIVDGIRKTLADQKFFTHKTIRDSGLTYEQYNMHLLEDEFWDPVRVELEHIEFNNALEAFEAVDKASDSELFSYAKRIVANSAKSTGELFNWFKNLTEGQSAVNVYDAAAKLDFINNQMCMQTLKNILQFETTEDLIARLAWSMGHITFNITEAYEIYNKLHIMDKQGLLEQAGIFFERTDNWVSITLDRSKHTYDCVTRFTDSGSVKEMLVDGVSIPKPKLAELNIDAVIEACAKEFADNVGVLDTAQLEELSRLLKAVREDSVRITDGLNTGLHADVLDVEGLRHIYNKMSDGAKKAFGDIDAMLANPAWFTGTVFNTSNLGTVFSKRHIQTASSLNIMQTFKRNMEYILTAQETRFKYIDYMCNNDMRLDKGIWADAAYDAQMLKWLQQHPEYTVVAITASTSKKGFDIKLIKPRNVEDLVQARRLGASIMTDDMYKRTVEVCYDSAYDKGMLKLFTNIARVYKIGQLVNPGTILRNVVDSTLKMFISTEDSLQAFKTGSEAYNNYAAYKKALHYMLATSDLDTNVVAEIAKIHNVSVQDVLNDIGFEVTKFQNANIKEIINASVLLDKYHTALDDIIKMHSNAVLRPDNVEFYFKYMSNGLDKETFYEVHRFITQGASAGAPDILIKALSKGKLPKSMRIDDTVVHLLSKLNGPNGHFEQLVRLTQHMQQTRSGMSFAESTWKISKTHFDYADKLDITKTIELLIPYYSFTTKNFAYWADLMETQPWIVKAFLEIMRQVWDFESYDTYAERLELANNESLKSQIVSGNIPLYDNGAVLKLNPSFMDVFNIVSNPLGKAESSLFAPLNAGFKAAMLELYNQDLTNEFVNNTFGLSDYAYENQLPWQQQAINNLPLVGPTIQRFTQQMPKYAERTDSPLVRVMPSMFGATSRWSEEGMAKIKSPEEWDAIKAGWLKNIVNNQIRYNQRRRQTAYRSRGSAKKTYFKSTAYGKAYSKNSRGNRYYSYYNPSYSKYVDYYNKPYSGRYDEHSFANKSRVSRPKRVYPENIYWKYYTKSGKKRWSILSAKATKKNLQMKIKLMYDYYK